MIGSSKGKEQTERPVFLRLKEKPKALPGVFYRIMAVAS
jgi:hypothetical protein